MWVLVSLPCEQICPQSTPASRPMVAGTNSSPREPDKDKWKSMDGFACLILIYCICTFSGRVVYSNNHATSCIKVVQCVEIYKTNHGSSWFNFCVTANTIHVAFLTWVKYELLPKVWVSHVQTCQSEDRLHTQLMVMFRFGSVTSSRQTSLRSTASVPPWLLYPT